MTSYHNPQVSFENVAEPSKCCRCCRAFKMSQMLQCFQNVANGAGRQNATGTLKMLQM